MRKLSVHQHFLLLTNREDAPLLGGSRWLFSIVMPPGGGIDLLSFDSNSYARNANYVARIIVNLELL